MCGICGFINLDGSRADLEIVERMNRALVHRGPEDSGVFMDGPVALAMHRLAIIDLEHGHQPMSNEDGTVWVILNGEIYNSPQLRRKLKVLGHSFATQSDTESIVHEYEESGPACTDHLRGMFAFAIWDRAEKRLVLARDRLGIKPLFYYQNDHFLAFSSELTSLVQHPEIPRAIDKSALHQYLATGAVAGPLTFFRNIRQVLPGQRLVLKGGRQALETYWQLPSEPSMEKPPSRQEAAAGLRLVLEQAVREHLLSDVPVGAFLSGGIDSSTVVALMARASGSEVSTFSIRFEDADYDEAPFSRMMANLYGTDHHEFTVRNQSFDFDLLQAMISHHGQPTADSSAIPTFIVSRLARSYVKVVLSGDGGDECFAGYPHFGWVKDIDRLYACPHVLRRLAAGVLQKAAVWRGFQQRDHVRWAINAVKASLAERSFLPLEVLRINYDDEIRDMLKPEWHISGSILLDSELDTFLHNVRRLDVIGRAQRFAFRYYLPDAYLSKVDRMSMANALEVRVPFLDHRVVEFSVSLPGYMHWRNGTGKQLLRQAVSDLLPNEIFNHRKQGFSIPLHRWATDAYFNLVEDLLNENAVQRRGMFNPVAVRHLISRCRGLKRHRRSLESVYRLNHRLLMLVVLEMWCRLYIDDLIEKPTETGRWEAEESIVSYGQ